MKLPHDKFCILPWVSLETSPIGTVRPCCLAEDEIVDELGNKYRLISTDLQQVQNSKYMQRLRQRFLNGEQPNTCQKCWNEESSGRTSKRMHTLDRLKHVIEDTEWTEDAKPLMFIDFKLGNICNLKCRICGSWSSSQFAAEEIKFSGKNNIHYQMLKDGAWPRENQTFWDNLAPLMHAVRYMEFTGGEPFMIQEHFDLLQRLVDAGVAENVEIHYNTNGTHYPERGEDIWKHFKTVEVAFSIDDIGKRFEYQRANAQWSDVQKNIQKFRLLRHRWNNIQLQVCSTVNVYNILYLEDLARWIDQQDFDFIYWNMLHEAKHLSVFCIPEKLKKLAIQKLNQAQVSNFHQNQFQQIIDCMINGNSLDGVDLLSDIDRLDTRRNQNLYTDHSELAEAIGYAM